ncbi:hypothetical protein BDFB_010339, partial [Asbolus verrucosus]
ISLHPASFCGPFERTPYLKCLLTTWLTCRSKFSKKINEINQNPLILQNVFNGVRRRSARCLDSGSGHFQNLL